MKSEPLILVSALLNAVVAPNVMEQSFLPIRVVVDNICATSLFTVTFGALIRIFPPLILLANNVMEFATVAYVLDDVFMAPVREVNFIDPSFLTVIRLLVSRHRPNWLFAKEIPLLAFSENTYIS